MEVWEIILLIVLECFGLLGLALFHSSDRAHNMKADKSWMWWLLTVLFCTPFGIPNIMIDGPRGFKKWFKK